jgi:hypothetical protein
MPTDDRRRIGSADARGAGKAAMPHRERLRMHALRYRIDELERLLAGEFASLETAPLLDELRALESERDALLARFSEP